MDLKNTHKGNVLEGDYKIVARVQYLHPTFFYHILLNIDPLDIDLCVLLRNNFNQF